MGPFSCHDKAAGGGLGGKPSGYLRQSGLEGLAVQSGGRDGLPGDFVFPGPDFLSVDHVGFLSVLDCLGLCLGFFDQGLQFSQFLNLAGKFSVTHGVYLLYFVWWSARCSCLYLLHISVSRVAGFCLRVSVPLYVSILAYCTQYVN